MKSFKFRKLLSTAAWASSLLLLLGACGQAASTPTQSQGTSPTSSVEASAPSSAPAQADAKQLKPGERLQVVTTIYPVYAAAQMVGGEDIDLHLMVDPGSEAHDWEPGPADLTALSQAHIFLSSGVGMDNWAERVEEASGSDRLVHLDLASKVKLQKINGEAAQISDYKEDEHEHHHHEHAIHKEDVENRELKEFAASYISLEYLYANKQLEKTVAAMAKAEKETEETIRGELVKVYDSDYDKIEITADGLKILDAQGSEVASGAYEADGFYFEDHGGHAHVWYQYKLKQATPKLPTYILINDHQYKANQPKEGSITHIHLAYSDKSYEDALEKAAVPFYVGADTDLQLLDSKLTQNVEEHAEHHHGGEEGHEHHHDGEEGHEHHHDGEEGHEHHHHHSHDPESIDPHIWLSPSNMAAEIDAIAAAFSSYDPAHAEAYQSRAKAAQERLNKLQASYQEALKPYQGKMIIVEHEAYGYLCKAFGLEQAGLANAFDEGEASPAKLAELAKKAKEAGVTTIFKEPMSAGREAETLAGEIGGKTAVLDPFESTDRDLKNAAEDYFTVMESNLKAMVASFQPQS